MRLENAFLPLFHDASPIPVPAIAHAGEDFMLYPKLEGRPLRSDTLKSLSEHEREHVAQELGAFLTALHGFRFSHPDLQEYPYGGSDFWQDLWEPVAPLLSERARRASQAYFERTIDTLDSQNIKQALVHADLGTSNILFDATHGGLSGIIDFGDLCRHDPARDFNGLFRNHGAAFTKQVLTHYHADVGYGFWERIEFYVRKHPFMLVFYAPLFGFEAQIPIFIEMIETQCSA